MGLFYPKLEYIPTSLLQRSYHKSYEHVCLRYVLILSDVGPQLAQLLTVGNLGPDFSCRVWHAFKVPAKNMEATNDKFVLNNICPTPLLPPTQPDMFTQVLVHVE